MCRQFRNLYSFTLPPFTSDGVSCGKPSCTVLHLLWKPAWTLKIFIEQLFQFKVLSKMMLQAHAWVQKHFSLTHYTDWNVNKLVWMDSCYSLSFRISFKLHFLGPIVIIMIFERFKMGVKQILLPCLWLFFSFLTREAKCKRPNFTYNWIKIETGLEKKLLRQTPSPPLQKFLGLWHPHPSEFSIPSVGVGVCSMWQGNLQLFEHCLHDDVICPMVPQSL